jgi:hypothetical protein
MEGQARDAVLRGIKAPIDNAEATFFKEVFAKMFSTEGYDRNVLSRLMKETALASRIDQNVLNRFLNYELELNIGAPTLLPQILNFIATDQSAIFCDQVKKLPSAMKFMIRDVMKLQLLSCTTLAIIELPTEESVRRSRLVFTTIEAFRPGSAQEPIVSELEKNVGDDVSGFQTCLKFADVPLEDMPNL